MPSKREATISLNFWVRGRYVVDGGVLELVLLLVVEYYAVVIDKVEDTSLPEGSREELHHEVVFPFLSEGGVRSRPTGRQPTASSSSAPPPPSSFRTANPALLYYTNIN